jgi:hypothetical protein
MSEKTVEEVLAAAVAPSVLNDDQARTVAEVCVEALEAAGYVVVRRDWLAEMHCPEAAGFEGPDTYGGCGKCPICVARGEAGPK